MFINKVKNLRNNTANFVHGAASERLRSWLRRRETDISNFVLQPICIQKLRKILKKLKGNRSCGNDFIDGFSIKMAAPIIEDILLHIVNLSINESIYSQFWKMSKIKPLLSHSLYDNSEYLALYIFFE